MTAPESGKWYLTTGGEHVRLLQKNERTYYVESADGKTFHIQHKELVMATDKNEISESLRKPDAVQPTGFKIDAELIPEHYDIRINGIHIEFHSDAELFAAIAGIESEIHELEKIKMRPLALSRLIAEKLESVRRIGAWMDSRPKGTKP